jgi:hypothetical protein
MTEHAKADDSLPALAVGDHVQDRESDEADTMVVVGLPVEAADAYEFGDGQTVADANPEYPADDAVVQVIFPEETSVDVRHHTRYSYPRSRLRRTASVLTNDGGESE